MVSLARGCVGMLLKLQLRSIALADLDDSLGVPCVHVAMDSLNW